MMHQSISIVYIIIICTFSSCTKSALGQGTPSKGKGYASSPTASPSASPAPTSCQDNPNRFPVAGVDTAQKSCDWVNRKPGTTAVPWRCLAHPEAAENCRISCNTCPSEAPSDIPSSAPSPSPSGLPSTVPSISPSSNPSLYPSNFPSDAPSSYPSGLPSDNPSESPSVSPSIYPSKNPSDIPTEYPTPNPNKSPTESPSKSPTKSPTVSPTCNVPSKGGKGSKGCTSAPTASPAPTACQDTSGRWPIIGANTATKTCLWVANGGVAPGAEYPWRCNAFDEPNEFCPLTCGTCPTPSPTPCTDTTERFYVLEADIPTTTKSCEWVARKDTSLRCSFEGVATLCSVTCNAC
mmetsp:Transcript_17822/g.21804  ORF Transcript_17822/g.21804 Transcript_17822/m.21804 type:complete len:350 (+) Transcript_17822:246-1295(+)